LNHLSGKVLMGVKNEYFCRGAFVVGNGLTTTFLEGPWLGDVPLAMQYPCLCHIVQ
jgi:hypothetical protein